MDQNLFNVIFTGKLLEGFEAETVIKNFAEKFKLPVIKASKVIQSQKDIILKPRVAHVKAYKIKSALEVMGLEVRLERAAIVAPKKVVKEEISKASTESSDEAKVALNSDLAKISTDKATSKTLGNPENNSAWALEPMAKNEPEEPVEDVQAETFVKQNEFINQTKTKAEPKTVQSIDNGRTVGDLIKTIGGWVVGIFAAGFILLKKFGLFKFLKVGGLMATAAFAGYESEEICMGNSSCEKAIDDQIDDCWEQSGLEDHDWDNMSDEEYFLLKPKPEQQFVACFVYEDTYERVLVSPMELRFDLIDSCFLTDNESCLTLAESQFKSCYAANDIEYLVSADTLDFYQAVVDNQSDFKNYYSCFVDESGAPLFDLILQNWDEMFESY